MRTAIKKTTSSKSKKIATIVPEKVEEVVVEEVSISSTTQNSIGIVSEAIFETFPGLEKLAKLPEDLIASIFTIVFSSSNKDVGKILSALKISYKRSQVSPKNTVAKKKPGRPRKNL